MESGAELEKERFITLFSPRDRIDLNPNDNTFISEERRIPDLGAVSLVGSGGRGYFDYNDDALGVTIIEGQVVIKKANELAEMGLFDIGLYLDNLLTEETSVICKMVYPQYNLSLEAPADIDNKYIDEVWGFADKWKIREDDREFYFFAPADPKFLSQLRFSFS